MKGFRGEKAPDQYAPAPTGLFNGDEAFANYGQSHAGRAHDKNVISQYPNVRSIYNASLRWQPSHHWYCTELGERLRNYVGAKNMWIHHFAQGGQPIEKWRLGNAFWIKSQEWYAGGIARQPNSAKVKFIIWWQGEANTATIEEAKQYDFDIAKLIHEWRKVYGFVWVFLMQIGPHKTDTLERFIRDRQWRYDQDSGDPRAIPKVKVIPTHDAFMPTDDNVHINTAGSIIVPRLYDFIRHFVYAETAIDCIPPRHTHLAVVGSTVEITFSRPINHHSNYDKFFHVYEDEVEQPIVDSARKGNTDPDHRVVVLTLKHIPTGTITVVGAPPLQTEFNLLVQRENTVKGLANNMPCYAFGPLGVDVYSNTL
jgi:hypothetical protein